MWAAICTQQLLFKFNQILQTVEALDKYGKARAPNECVGTHCFLYRLGLEKSRGIAWDKTPTKTFTGTSVNYLTELADLQEL